MTDIVKRLTSLADCDARAGEPLGKCMREAAAEILSLRAERDALREALEKLASFPPPPTVAWEIARAALKLHPASTQEGKSK